MAVSGSQKEQKPFEPKQNYVGLFKGNVVAINPSADKLSKLLGEEIDENKDWRLKYTDEKEGVDIAYIRIWFEVEGKNLYLPYTITLKNEIRRNKAGDKIELINSVGDSKWVEADAENSYDESELWESFKHFSNVTSWQLPSGDVSEKWEKGAKPAETEILGDKIYRAALQGEGELLNFMKVWLAEGDRGINLRSPEANLLLDTNLLFRGKFKELELWEEPFAAPVVGMAYVVVDDEDSTKQYQRIYRVFLPGKFMKSINNGCRFKNGKHQEIWDKFVEDLEGEYGISDGAYKLGPITEYNPDEDIATSTTAKADVTPTNSKY